MLNTKRSNFYRICIIYTTSIQLYKLLIIIPSDNFVSINLSALPLYIELSFFFKCENVFLRMFSYTLVYKCMKLKIMQIVQCPMYLGNITMWHDFVSVGLQLAFTSLIVNPYTNLSVLSATTTGDGFGKPGCDC